MRQLAERLSLATKLNDIDTPFEQLLGHVRHFISRHVTEIDNAVETAISQMAQAIRAAASAALPVRSSRSS